MLDQLEMVRSRWSSSSIISRGIELALHGLKRSSSMTQGFKTDMTKGGEFTVTGEFKKMMHDHLMGRERRRFKHWISSWTSV